MRFCPENKKAATREAYLHHYIQISLFVILPNSTIFLLHTTDLIKGQRINFQDKREQRQKTERKQKGCDFSQGVTSLSKVASAIF